ncbi:MAG: PepSY domain-containing protein, partial [Bacteroidales bacterium]|nr:PepSY domain-containing protein [Bacteroidales bacterium]MCF8458469.1 PepSY domain-containing protein [Bacteroidales bacterium]
PQNTDRATYPSEISMKQNWKIYKKLHKWPGLILSFLLLYYGATGIFMNHRKSFSGIDISRDILPNEYQYSNWNNGALKGNLFLSKDSVLVFGNIGIWLCDSNFTHYSSFNSGFRKGMDNRKIFDVHQSENGDLYAATQFGLFGWNKVEKKWQKFNLNTKIDRFVGLESVGDTIYAINRSYLFKGKSEGCNTKFQQIELAQPDGHTNKVGLFQTIWQIHSGEILGLPGQLFVDFLGLITIFLSLTGIVYFFFPGWIKRRKRRLKPRRQIVRLNKWSLKWHNKTGAWFFVFLSVLFFTGIFLRPPLLIAIANAEVRPIKFSHLDQPNPWYDKLRDILYDEAKGIFLLSSSKAMFYLEKGSKKPIPFRIQPPVSVMGINSFEPYNDGAYLIGSFAGLFLWHPNHPEIFNYADGTLYKPQTSGNPIGDFKVTGVLKDKSGNTYLADYDLGILPLRHTKASPEMPKEIIEESKMSLWNVSLEIHTGRIFNFLIGSFYILIVPLSGLAGVVVVISGYVLWRRKYKRKENKNQNL